MEKTKEPLIFVKIHLQSTEECLCELSSETYYKIGSVFETINGIDCIVKLDGNEFCIAAKNLNTNLKKQPYLCQRVCYGFCEQFPLLNANTSYLVEKGVKDFRMNPSLESSDGDDKELYNIVYRLHFLLMSLILKKSGFCGYLLELVNIHVIKEGKSPFRLV